MHSNSECRTQHPSLPQLRQANTACPMGRSTSTPSGPAAQGLMAVSNLTDAEKARLSDHLQKSQANLAASEPTNNANENNEASIMYLANAYSAIAQSTVKNHDMVSDTGADRFIFHSINQFINLCPTPLIAIKTADGSCNLIARHTGDVVIESFNEDGNPMIMTIPETLYCPNISINLISATRLCDLGATFSGTDDCMVYQNKTSGEELHAIRSPKTNELWTVQQPSHTSCLSVSTDIIHQHLGHLHSKALQRFCNWNSKSNTVFTSCAMAKSHCHQFKSQLPRADRLLYCVHSDVVGPFETQPLSGKRYFVTFINEHSRYTWVYLMKHKSEVFEKLKEYITES